MIEVNYYELLENIENFDSKAWKDAEEIASKIKTKAILKSDKHHVLWFINTFLLKKEIKEKLNLDWFNKDAYTFSNKWIKTPDFIGKDGKTASIISVNRLDSLNKLRDRTFKKSDIKLVYCRTENVVYSVTEKLDGSWNSVEICDFRPTRISVEL